MSAFLIDFVAGAFVAWWSYRYGRLVGRRETNRQWHAAIGSLSGILKERASDG